MHRLQKCLVGAQDLQLENTVVRGLHEVEPGNLERTGGLESDSLVS